MTMLTTTSNWLIKVRCRMLGFIRAITGQKLYLQFLRAIPLFTFTHDSCVYLSLALFIPLGAFIDLLACKVCFQ